MTRGSQAQLREFSQEQPGALAARLMQVMEDRVGRDGERKKWKRMDMPPAGKSYFWRVLRVTYPQAGLRNLQEMQTLCCVLDHLAHQRYGEAADTVGQRLKAVEAAVADSSWDRAKFLELVGQEDALLASRGEQQMVQQERKVRQRLGNGGTSGCGENWSGGGWSGAKGLAKGKGYQMGKGDKGAGKGKDRKGYGGW